MSVLFLQKVRNKMCPHCILYGIIGFIVSLPIIKRLLSIWVRRIKAHSHDDCEDCDSDEND